MENTSNSGLEFTELRKKNLRKTLQQVHDNASSILLLTVQWKELEQHFDNVHSSIEERSKELLAIEATIKEHLKELKEREEKLDLDEESIEERFRQVEVKEKEFELSQKLAVEEQQIGIKWIEESRKKLELGQENAQKMLQELEVKEKDFVSINRLIDDRFEELNLREEIFVLKEMQFVEEVKEKEKKYEECCKEIKLQEMQFELRSKEVELKDKQLEKWFKEVDSKGKKCEEFSNDVKKLEEQSNELKLKEKQLEEQCREFELKEKQVEERSKEVELKDKKFEERFEELEVKLKQVEERSKELELKEKRYANTLHTPMKTEPATSAALRFCVHIDGKCLQIFPNEQWKSHDSMRNDVLVALQLSSDPAKLVLDAMQGFYPPHLEKGDVEFEESVIRRTCILLLEQLMKLSPEIKPNVIKEAMKLAFDWITKMRVDVRHSLEVWGFLQLLATYKLAHAFDADELLNYLAIVADHNQAPELLRGLGFAEKISGFIQNLISKDQEVEAIKFIYAFELGAQFPPVPLLENYLQRSRKDADKFMKEGNTSLKGHNEARNKRVADLKAVIRCIEDHKLESEYPPIGLKRLVAWLENQNANSQLATLALGPKIPSKLQSGSKRPWTAELGEDSLNAFDSATSIVSSVQMPCQQPKFLNFNQDFIRNLIKSEQRLEAIEYVYAWNMVDKFPPVNLLNDHLIYSKNIAEGFCKKNNNSVSAQVWAIRKEISTLKDVIKCIEEYRLEPELSPNILKERIVELEKKSEKQAKIGPHTRSKAKLLQQQKEKKCNAPTSASSSPAIPATTKVTIPSPTAEPTTATVPATKLQQESGKKRPRIAVSAKQPPHQRPAMLTIQGIPYMNAPAHYNLASFIPMNLNTSSYHNNFNPYYPWYGPRRPGYY